MNSAVNHSSNRAGLTQHERDNPPTQPGLPTGHLTATGAARVERSSGPRSAARVNVAAWPQGDVSNQVPTHPPSEAPPHPQAPPRRIATSAARSAFVPLLLGGTALLGAMAFQTYQHLGDYQSLQSAFAAQQQTVDNAGKLRASLDTLAADTQRLADAGNTSARLLVDELKRRGVTINTAGAAPR